MSGDVVHDFAAAGGVSDVDGVLEIKMGRQRGWRYYLDYGGGLMTDWGVHLADTALWFMDAQLEALTVREPRHERTRRFLSQILT